METLTKILESMNHVISAPVLASIAVGLEIVFRMMKTEKPMSWLYVVSDVFKKSGEILSKAGQVMDKVLPQRVK